MDATNQRIEILMKEIKEEIMEWKSQQLERKVNELKKDNEELQEKYNEKEIQVEELIERNRKLEIAAERGKNGIKKLKGKANTYSDDQIEDEKIDCICYSYEKRDRERKECE